MGQPGLVEYSWPAGEGNRAAPLALGNCLFLETGAVANIAFVVFPEIVHCSSFRVFVKPGEFLKNLDFLDNLQGLMTHNQLDFYLAQLNYICEKSEC